MTHAFYADMGGFRLEGDGIPHAFPVTAKQLLFLIEKKYVEYPTITEEEIKDKNKSDRLARILAIGQALWLIINVILRAARGLAITTLELTTVSFVIMFLATSFCWYYKPSDIVTATIIRSNTHIDIIRAENCSRPSQRWYESPLDFLREDRFYCDLHWKYYNQILERIHMPILSRPMTRPLWDRIPSDSFPQVDVVAECIAAPLIIMFGIILMLAWKFDFPTPVERVMWQAGAICTLLYAVVGGLHAFFSHKIFLPKSSSERKQEDEPSRFRAALLPIHGNPAERLAARLRNIDPEHDPNNTIPLRVLIPATVLSAIYLTTRAFVLIEDIIGLRSLPASAFQTVSWSDYVPHL